MSLGVNIDECGFCNYMETCFTVKLNFNFEIKIINKDLYFYC